MAEALIVIDMLEGYMKDTDNPMKKISNISSLICNHYPQSYQKYCKP